MILRNVLEISFAAAVPVAAAAVGSLSEPNTLFAWLAVVLIGTLIAYVLVKIIQALRNPGSDTAALERRLDARRSTSIAGLHNRINQVEKDLKDEISEQGKTLAAVETTANLTNQTVNQMDTKFDNILIRLTPNRRREP